MTIWSVLKFPEIAKKFRDLAPLNPTVKYKAMEIDQYRASLVSVSVWFLFIQYNLILILLRIVTSISS